MCKESKREIIDIDKKISLRVKEQMEKTQKERPFCCRAQTDLWYNGLETVGSSPRRRGRPVWMRAGAVAAGAFAHRDGGAAGVSRPCRAAHPLPRGLF